MPRVILQLVPTLRVSLKSYGVFNSDLNVYLFGQFRARLQSVQVEVGHSQIKSVTCFLELRSECTTDISGSVDVPGDGDGRINTLAAAFKGRIYGAQLAGDE